MDELVRSFKVYVKREITRGGRMKTEGNIGTGMNAGIDQTKRLVTVKINKKTNMIGME